MNTLRYLFLGASSAVLLANIALLIEPFRPAAKAIKLMPIANALIGVGIGLGLFMIALAAFIARSRQGVQLSAAVADRVVPVALVTLFVLSIFAMPPNKITKQENSWIAEGRSGRYELSEGEAQTGAHLKLRYGLLFVALGLYSASLLCVIAKSPAKRQLALDPQSHTPP